MTDKLLIIGSGGHARCIGEIAATIGYSCTYIDLKGSSEHSVVSESEVLSNPGEYCLGKYRIISGIGEVGDIGKRKRIIGEYEGLFGSWFITIISPSATVSSTVKIEPGVFVGPGAIINCGAQIERHAIINSGAIVEHDCQVGSYCHIAPGAVLSGGVVVGCETLIGAGAILIQQVNIAEQCLIAAGSVVCQNILTAKVMVAGTPAQIKKVIV